MSDAQKAVHLGHPVKHTLGFLGMLLGVLLGAALGILAALTFGLGAIAVIGAACAGASILGGLGMSLGSGKGITTGLIIMPCAIDVLSEGKPAAHTTSLVGCGGTVPFFSHGGATIAEGSQTVLVNGKYAARVNSRATCGAIAGGGCSSVIIGGPTVQVAPIKSDIPKWAGTFLKVLGMVGGLFLGIAGVASFSKGILNYVYNYLNGMIKSFVTDFLTDLFFKYICTSDDCRETLGYVMAAVALYGLYKGLQGMAAQQKKKQAEENNSENSQAQQTDENTTNASNDNEASNNNANQKTEDNEKAPALDDTNQQADDSNEDIAASDTGQEENTNYNPDVRKTIITDENGTYERESIEYPDGTIFIKEKFVSEGRTIIQETFIDADGFVDMNTQESLFIDGEWSEVEYNPEIGNVEANSNDFLDYRDQVDNLPELPVPGDAPTEMSFEGADDFNPNDDDIWTGQRNASNFGGERHIESEYDTNGSLDRRQWDKNVDIDQTTSNQADDQWQKDPLNDFVDAEVHFLKDEFGVDDEWKKAQFGTENLGAEVKLGSYELGSEYTIGLSDDGLQAAAGASAQVSLIKVDANAAYDGEYLDAGAGGTAYVGGKIEGAAELKFNPLDGEVEVEIGAGAFAGAKAQGEVNVTVADTVGATVKGGVSIGIGAEFNSEFEYDDGKIDFEFKAGASLGLGAEFGVQIEADFSEQIDKLKDFFFGKEETPEVPEYIPEDNWSDQMTEERFFEAIRNNKL